MGVAEGVEELLVLVLRDIETVDQLDVRCRAFERVREGEAMVVDYVLFQRLAEYLSRALAQHHLHARVYENIIPQRTIISQSL